MLGVIWASTQQSRIFVRLLSDTKSWLSTCTASHISIYMFIHLCIHTTTLYFHSPNLCDKWAFQKIIYYKKHRCNSRTPGTVDCGVCLLFAGVRKMTIWRTPVLQREWYLIGAVVYEFHPLYQLTVKACQPVLLTNVIKCLKVPVHHPCKFSQVSSSSSISQQTGTK